MKKLCPNISSLNRCHLNLVLVAALFYTLICSLAFAQTSVQENTLGKFPTNEQLIAAYGNQNDNFDFDQKVAEISHYFVGTKYVLGPAGEGSEGDFDQRPLTTFDFFDCVTYVEATLALALMDHDDLNLQNVTERFLTPFYLIKYNQYGEFKYQERNHFTEIDWIKNQIDKGILVDEMALRSDSYQTQSKIIYKRKWYLGKTINDLFLPNANITELEQKLLELQNIGYNYPAEGEAVSLKYFPWDALKKIAIETPEKMPNVAVFSLIRGDYLEPEKTMPVMVSHQGFVIKLRDNTFIVRHASSKYGKVYEEPLLQYIATQQENNLKSKWPSLGFHLLTVPSSYR